MTTKQLSLIDNKKPATKAVAAQPEAPVVSSAQGLCPDLTTILEWPRSHNSESEKNFRQWVLGKVNEYAPANSTSTILDDGTILAEVIDGTTPTTVAFACHMDTVDWAGVKGPKAIYYDQDFERVTLKEGSAGGCLGADDGVGVWILLEMIKAAKPGLYIFHTGEECGQSTAKALVRKADDFLKGIDIIAEFDRPGLTDIVTHQRGGTRCASDKFAAALASKLNAAGALSLSQSTRGVYTDCYEYRGIIPECVNISVGYTQQHSKHEDLDVGFATQLLAAVIAIDWNTLPVDRDPAVPEPTATPTVWGKYRSGEFYDDLYDRYETPAQSKPAPTPAAKKKDATPKDDRELATYKSAREVPWTTLDVEDDPEGAVKVIRDLTILAARLEAECEVLRNWSLS